METLPPELQLYILEIYKNGLNKRRPIYINTTVQCNYYRYISSLSDCTYSS